MLCRGKAICSVVQGAHMHTGVRVVRYVHLGVRLRDDGKRCIDAVDWEKDRFWQIPTLSFFSINPLQHERARELQ